MGVIKCIFKLELFEEVEVIILVSMWFWIYFSDLIIVFLVSILFYLFGCIIYVVYNYFVE